MPNHVTNHIKISGDPKRIKELLEAVKYDDVGLGSIDFNKVIPKPASLDIECGSNTDAGLKAYRDFISVYTLEGTRHIRTSSCTVLPHGMSGALRIGEQSGMHTAMKKMKL